MGQPVLQQQPAPAKPCAGYVRTLRKAMWFLAALVVLRLVLEAVGLRHTVTQYLSSSAAVFLIALYFGAIAPTRGLSRFSQVILPALLLAVWTQLWIIIATVVSAVFRLTGSHFAEAEDFGNWRHLGQHVLGHVVETIPFFIGVLILIATLLLLHRWPVTVGPAAVLGALVIIRFWAEAMGVTPARTAAFSSTVALLVYGFYLGGVGPLLNVTSARRLLAPALALGWVWRFWVFVAAIMGAAMPFYHTHFFDPSTGRIPLRLVQYLAGAIVEGFIAGIIVWIVACWISRAVYGGGAQR